MEPPPAGIVPVYSPAGPPVRDGAGHDALRSALLGHQVHDRPRDRRQLERQRGALDPRLERGRRDPLRLVQRVRGGVQRMGMLIDALLQLSRVTRSELQREPTDLTQLSSQVFHELLANEPGRVVRFEVKAAISAEADPRLMRVAFENLLLHYKRSPFLHFKVCKKEVKH